MSMMMEGLSRLTDELRSNRERSLHLGSVLHGNTLFRDTQDFLAEYLDFRQAVRQNTSVKHLYLTLHETTSSEFAPILDILGSLRELRQVHLTCGGGEVQPDMKGITRILKKANNVVLLLIEAGKSKISAKDMQTLSRSLKGLEKLEALYLNGGLMLSNKSQDEEAETEDAPTSLESLLDPHVVTSPSFSAMAHKNSLALSSFVHDVSAIQTLETFYLDPSGGEAVTADSPVLTAATIQCLWSKNNLLSSSVKNMYGVKQLKELHLQGVTLDSSSCVALANQLKQASCPWTLLDLSRSQFPTPHQRDDTFVLFEALWSNQGLQELYLEHVHVAHYERLFAGAARGLGQNSTLRKFTLSVRPCVDPKCRAVTSVSVATLQSLLKALHTRGRGGTANADAADGATPATALQCLRLPTLYQLWTATPKGIADEKSELALRQETFVASVTTLIKRNVTLQELHLGGMPPRLDSYDQYVVLDALRSNTSLWTWDAAHYVPLNRGGGDVASTVTRQDMIDFRTQVQAWLRLNLAGRQQHATRHDDFDVLGEVSDDLTCIYLHMREQAFTTLPVTAKNNASPWRRPSIGTKPSSMTTPRLAVVLDEVSPLGPTLVCKPNSTAESDLTTPHFNFDDDITTAVGNDSNGEEETKQPVSGEQGKKKKHTPTNAMNNDAADNVGSTEEEDYTGNAGRPLIIISSTTVDYQSVATENARQHNKTSALVEEKKAEEDSPEATMAVLCGALHTVSCPGLNFPGSAPVGEIMSPSPPEDANDGEQERQMIITEQRGDISIAECDPCCFTMEQKDDTSVTELDPSCLPFFVTPEDEDTTNAKKENAVVASQLNQGSRTVAAQSDAANAVKVSEVYNEITLEELAVSCVPSGEIQFLPYNLDVEKEHSLALSALNLEGTDVTTSKRIRNEKSSRIDAAYSEDSGVLALVQQQMPDSTTTNAAKVSEAYNAITLEDLVVSCVPSCEVELWPEDTPDKNLDVEKEHSLALPAASGLLEGTNTKTSNSIHDGKLISISRIKSVDSEDSGVLALVQQQVPDSDYLDRISDAAMKGCESVEQSFLCGVGTTMAEETNSVPKFDNTYSAPSNADSDSHKKVLDKDSSSFLKDVNNNPTTSFASRNCLATTHQEPFPKMSNEKDIVDLPNLDQVPGASKDSSEVSSADIESINAEIMKSLSIMQERIKSNPKEYIPEKLGPRNHPVKKTSRLVTDPHEVFACGRLDNVCDNVSDMAMTGCEMGEQLVAPSSSQRGARPKELNDSEHSASQALDRQSPLCFPNHSFRDLMNDMAYSSCEPQDKERYSEGEPVTRDQVEDSSPHVASSKKNHGSPPAEGAQASMLDRLADMAYVNCESGEAYACGTSALHSIKEEPNEELSDTANGTWGFCNNDTTTITNSAVTEKQGCFDSAQLPVHSDEGQGAKLVAKDDALQISRHGFRELAKEAREEPPGQDGVCNHLRAICDGSASVDPEASAKSRIKHSSPKEMRGEDSPEQVKQERNSLSKTIDLTVATLLSTPGLCGNAPPIDSPPRSAYV